MRLELSVTGQMLTGVQLDAKTLKCDQEPGSSLALRQALHFAQCDIGLQVAKRYTPPMGFAASRCFRQLEYVDAPRATLARGPTIYGALLIHSALKQSCSRHMVRARARS